MSFNQVTDEPSYKYYLGSFKKDTNDYHLGKDNLETWDKDSLAEYCTYNFEHILRNNYYTHVFQIPKRFLKFFDCSCQSEFEEEVLISILRKLCVKYGQDFDHVLIKIFEKKCVSYKEDFN